MHRFYIQGGISSDAVIVSDTRQLHHLRNVLRLKVGDEVDIFDETGSEYSARIFALDKRKAFLTIKSRKPVREKKFKIAIACAIPKKSIMDDIVDKLTQLGVDAIIPVVTERVIIKLDDKADFRLERWRKIALSAAEQSQRSSLPAISPAASLQEAISQAAGFNLKVIATTAGERKTLREIIAACRPSAIFVLIGPEGDFTAKEAEYAIREGFIPVSLGDSILRVETAAIAVASYLRFTLQD